jgi:(p)ppGpp synthase/HD superfamily hydrolase
MTDIVTLAKKFAVQAHDAIGQKRKYSGKPYWVHPQRVAELVKSVGGTPEMQAAAWLHDTVEDTPATIEDIKKYFGDHVAGLVDDLTDVSTLDQGNRATRKAIDREHSAQASPEAQTIKLADLIDNTESIVKNDRNFAKIYLAEKRLLLDVLTKGNEELQKMAWEGLVQGLKELESE